MRFSPAWGGILASLLALAGNSAWAASFGGPVTVATDGGSEPTIDAAPDGTLYVTGTTGLCVGCVPLSIGAVYRSDDGGATWRTTPSSLRQIAVGGGDIDLVVAPNGSIATTDLWLGNSSVAVSADKGETWLASPLQGVPVQDRQWLAATPSGYYHVVHQVPLGDVVSFSQDGLVYPIQTLGASPLDQTGCICAPGNIVAEGGGLLGDRIAFVYPTTTRGVGVSRSSNGGLTWSVSYPGQSVNAGGVTGFPAIATDGFGRLAAVWQPDGSGDVYLVTSSNFGASWTAPRLIENAGTSVYPWVAYRNGKIAVSYYHTSATASAADDVPESASWTISYRDSVDNFVSRADIETIKNGPICTMGLGCSEDRELGDFQSVDLTPAGKAVIAYNRSLGGDRTEVRFVKEN
jgi:hypothetical protein